MHKLKDFLLEQSRMNIIGVFFIFFTAIIAPFYGGWDYLTAFRGETLSGQYYFTFNPLPAYSFFYLFAILPPITGYMVWNLVNAAGFVYALNHWKANIFAFAITIVCFWNFFGGQFEGVLCASIVILLTANPWVAGIGLFFLTFKPQLGFIIILFALIKRRDWRMLAIPGFLYLLSFIVYGWWVPDWLRHVRYGYENQLFGNTNISIYPIGILFILLIFRYYKSLKVWILSASLAMPYFPIYSLASLFTMEPPAWWFSIAIWAFYIIPDIFPNLAFVTTIFSYIIPLLLLLAQIRKEEKNRQLIGTFIENPATTMKLQN